VTEGNNATPYLAQFALMQGGISIAFTIMAYYYNTHINAGIVTLLSYFQAAFALLTMSLSAKQATIGDPPGRELGAIPAAIGAFSLMGGGISVGVWLYHLLLTRQFMWVTALSPLKVASDAERRRAAAILRRQASRLRRNSKRSMGTAAQRHARAGRSPSHSRQDSSQSVLRNGSSGRMPTSSSQASMQGMSRSQSRPGSSRRPAQSRQNGPRSARRP
jgi:hypothetical protein